MEKRTNKDGLSKKDFKRLFNMNNILSQLINWAAYIIVVISLGTLIYFSFVETIDIKIDWKTFTIFALVAVILSWSNWNTWYKKQYESVMAQDIAQQEENKYSIHSRYYVAIKDWTDPELQLSIDKFNAEYEAKWLRWVEKYTGYPIETREDIELDKDGNPVIESETVVLDEYGEEVLDIDFNPVIYTKYKTIVTKGIKDLPYRGFKHKILMWRIKTHHYPQSGYKTSMELMSLFSFQEANMDKRSLNADKKFYTKNSLKKLFFLILTISLGASIVPNMIQGEWWSALLKLIIAIGSLLSSILMGAISGVRGARIKLSTVEDACQDLELWAQKKPVIAPYKEPKEDVVKEPKEKISTDEVTNDIFDKTKFTK